MANAHPTIALSVSRDIPFNKLVLSQANVRRIKAGVAIEELAEDIARRTLLQSLTVRPVLDDSGAETGMYEVPAGAAVSPKLLDVYAEDGMTLEQLMAFTVNPDFERQEQTWEALQPSHSKESYQIRRLLTEGAVRASDKRAQFVGVEAYEEEGGTILRDLFEPDDGGWLREPALLKKLVAEKLERDAEAIRGRGLEVGRGGARAPLRPRPRAASAQRHRGADHRPGSGRP